MIDLTDKEVNTIYEIVERVRTKHMDGSDVNWEKLGRLQRELQGRLEDAGYFVAVDVTPLMAGDPPQVRINGHIDGTDGLDHERKAYEIRKRQERKDDDPNDKIEGII